MDTGGVNVINYRVSAQNSKENGADMKKVYMLVIRAKKKQLAPCYVQFFVP